MRVGGAVASQSAAPPPSHQRCEIDGCAALPSRSWRPLLGNLQKETLQKETLQKEPLQKEILQKETLQKETLQKEHLQKEPLQKETLQKVTYTAIFVQLVAPPPG